MPRMAFYTMGLERYKEPGKPPSFMTKLGIGSMAGAAASMIGVPTDVVMVCIEGIKCALRRTNSVWLFAIRVSTILEQGYGACEPVAKC